jgi:hypothetical protein
MDSLPPGLIPCFCVGINPFLAENGRKIPARGWDVVRCLYPWRTKEYGLYAL